MLKVTLREPVPDGLQGAKSVFSSAGDETQIMVNPQYARTMQTFIVEGNLEDFSQKARENQPLPLDDTWFEFVKQNGKKILVPGSNLAAIEEL